MADMDSEIQMLEQHRLIEQLKSMIRDKDEAFKNKETELQDVNAKLSKLKLQTKAKLAREAKDARDVKGDKSSASTHDNKDKDVLEDKAAEEGQEKTSRGKNLLMKKKLEEKERQIGEKQEELAIRDQHIAAKERIISERDDIIGGLTQQLQDKAALMEELQSHRPGGGGDLEDRVEQMYAQILYKDKNLMEMNNRLLEQERRIIDIQELVGEKHEVIRGRDKVIELLQATIKEHGENTAGLAILISKLTGKVESNDETLDNLNEQVMKAEHGLKIEREQFDMRLSESLIYFEETLKEHEENISKLRKLVQDKEEKLLVSENDLRELIVRQEKDIQKIMEKGVDIQDPVIQMLEQKLKDINHVLEGKIQVIEVLQRESSQKEKELIESQNIQKNYKERLQVMSEQMMLFQANFADLESQWQEERQKLETKMQDIVEKHEYESMEKDLQIETLKTSIGQFESLYKQSMSQYQTLQGRYDQSIKPGAAVSVPEDVKESSTKDIDKNLNKLNLALKEKEHVHEELECLKKQTESLSLMLVERESEINEMKNILEVKEAALDEMRKLDEDDTTETPATSKTQLMSKVELLEKELTELRKEEPMDVSALQNRLAELEDEKGSLQLKLVDFDEVKSIQGELESQLQELQARITTMEVDKQALDTQLLSLASERDSLSQTVHELQDALNQNQLKHDECQLQQISDLEMEVRCKGEEVIQLQDELKVAMGMLEMEKSLVSQLRAENVTLEVRTVEAEEQKDGSDKEKLALEEKIKTLSHTIEVEMQQPLIDIETERNELRHKVVILENDLESQRGFTKQQKDEINTLSSKLNDLKSRWTSEKSTLEQTIADMELLKVEQFNTNAGMAQELNILKEEKLKTSETLHQTTEVSQSIKLQLEGRLAEIQSQVDKKNKTIQSLESVNSNLKQSESELQEKIENIVCEIQEINSSHKNVVNKLEKDLIEIGTKLTESIQNNDYLQQDLSNRNKEMEHVNESKSEVGNKLREKELELKQYVREMDILKQGQSLKGEEFESKFQSLLSQLAELEKKYYIKSSTCDKQLAEIDSLQVNINQLHLEINTLNVKLEEENSSRTTILSAKDEEILELTSTLTTLKKTCEHLECQCHSHESEIQRTKTDLAEITEQKSLLKNKLQSEMDAVRCSQQRELKLQQENNIVQNLIAEKDLQIHTFKLTEEEYSQECSKKDLVIQDLKNNYSEILSEKLKLENDLDVIVTDKEAEIISLSENIKLLNEDIVNYKQHINTNGAHVEDLSKKLSNVSMEHATSLEDIQTEMETANQHIENLNSIATLKEEEEQKLLKQLQESCNMCTSLESTNSELLEQNSVLERELNEIRQYFNDKTANTIGLSNMLDATENELDNVSSTLEIDPIKCDHDEQLAATPRDTDRPPTSCHELPKQVSDNWHACIVLHEKESGMQNECEYEHELLSPQSSSMPQVQVHNGNINIKTVHSVNNNTDTSSETSTRLQHASSLDQKSACSVNTCSGTTIEKVKSYTETNELEKKCMLEKFEALSELNSEQLCFIETLQKDMKSKSVDLHSMEAKVESTLDDYNKLKSKHLRIVSQLESQNESKTREIEHLFCKIEEISVEGNHEIARLEKQVEQLQVQNDDLIKLKITVMKQTENMTDRLNMLEAEVNPKQQTANRVIGNISFEEAENISLCENVGGWKTEFDVKCTQIHELITNLQHARSGSDELVATVHSELEVRKQEVDTLSLKLKQANVELVKLKDETTALLDNKEIQVQRLEAKSVALEEESSLQRRKLEESDVDQQDKMSQIIVCKNQMDNLSCENDAMKVLISDLTKSAKECQSVLEESQSENNALRCELETSQRMLEDKLSQLTDLNLNIESITCQTSDEIKMLKREIQTLSVEKEEVETNGELIKREVRNLKQEISTASIEFQQYKENVTEERIQKDVEHELDVKNVMHSKLESEREWSAAERHFQNTISQIQMELQEAAVDITEKDISIENHISHISEMDDVILLKEKQCTDLEAVVEILQDKINMMGLEIDSLKSENKNVEHLRTKLVSVVKDKDSQLEFLKTELKCGQENTSEVSDELSVMCEQISIKNEEIEHLTFEVCALKEKCFNHICQIDIITASLDETKSNVNCAEASALKLQISLAEKEAILSTSTTYLANLENQLATKESNIAMLTNRLADAEHKIIQRDKEVKDRQINTNEQFTEIKATNLSLNDKLENCNANVSLLEEELLKVQQSIHEKENIINSMNTASSELKMKIMEMQNDTELSVQNINELEGSLMLSINRCGDLETEILYNKQEFKNCEAHISELQDRVMVLTDESDELSGQVDELRQRLCAAENVIDDLESRVSSLTEALENVNIEKTAMQTVVIESASSFSKLNEQYNNLVSDNSLKLTEITELQHDLACKCEQIIQLEEKLNGVSEDNSASLASIDSLKLDCVDRENVVHELETDIEQFTTWKEGAEKDIDSLKDNLVKKEAEASFLNSELVEALQEKKQLYHTVDELNSVKDNLEVQNDGLYQDSVKKAQTICDLMAKVSELENLVLLKGDEAHLLEDLVEAKKIDVEALSKEIVSKHSMLKQNQQIISELEISLFISANESKELNLNVIELTHKQTMIEATLEQQHTDITEKQSEINALNDIIKVKEEQSKSDTEQVKSLLEKNNTSEQEAEMASSQLKELNQTVIEKDNEISNLINNVQELEATIHKVKEERDLKIELLAENVSDLVTQIDLYSAQKDEIQSELNDAWTNLQNTEAARGELEDKLTFTDKCLEENSVNLTLLQGQFSSLSREHNNLLLASAENEKSIIEKNSQIESLSLEKQDMLLSLSQKDKLLNSYKEEVDTLNKSISKLEEIMTVNREIIDEKDQEFQQIKNELSESLAMCIDKSDTITELNRVICTLKEDISSQDTTVSNLQNDVTTEKHANEILCKQITNTNSQIDILECYLTEMKDKHLSTVTAVTQLNCQNQSLKKKIERYDERIDEAFTKESELKGFLDDYVKQVDNHNVEIKNLKTTIESMKLDAEHFHELFINEKDAHNETKLMMESVINEKDQTMKTLEAQIKIICDEKEVLNEKFLGVDSQTKQLNCQLNKISEESQNMEKKQLEEVEMQLLEKFQWLSELRQENEKKDKKLVENEKKICDLDKQNIMLKSDFTKLQEQYRHVIGQMDDSVRENKELLLSLEEGELQHGTESQQIKQLATSETDLKFEVEVLKMELLEKGEEVVAIEREKSNIHSVLKNAEAKSLSVILELETEKDSLMAEIEETKASHLEELSKLEHDYKLLENLLNECRNEEQSLTETLKASDCHVNELEEHLVNLSHCNKEKDEQIVSLSREIEELKTQNLNLGDAIIGIKEDVKTIRSKYVATESELKSSNAYAIDADQRIKSVIKSSEEMSAKIEEKECEITRLLECLDNYKIKNDALLSDIANKDFELLVLSDSLNDVTQTTMSDKSVLSHLMFDLNSLNKKMVCLIESVIVKDDIIDDVNSQLEKTKIALTNIESNLKKAHFKSTTIEDEADEETEAMTDNVEEVDTLLSSIQQKLREKLDNNDKNEDKLESSHEENLKLKSDRSELFMKISTLESEITTLSSTISKLEEDCSKSKLIVSEKDSHIEYLLQSSHCITESISDKESELKSHLEINKRLDDDCLQLSTFLNDKEKELTETTSRLSSLEQRFLELKRKESESTEIKERNSQLSSLLHDKDNDLLLQIQKMKQLDETNADLNKNVCTILSQNEILTEELASTMNNIVSASAAFNKMQYSVKLLEEKVIQLTQSESKLEANVYRLTIENIDAVENTNKLIVSLDVSNQQLDERLKELEILNNIVSEKNALMARTASESDNKICHLSDENERLNENMEILKSQLKDALNEQIQKMKQLDETNADLNKNVCTILLQNEILTEELASTMNNIVSASAAFNEMQYSVKLLEEKVIQLTQSESKLEANVYRLTIENIDAVENTNKLIVSLDVSNQQLDERLKELEILNNIVSEKNALMARTASESANKICHLSDENERLNENMEILKSQLKDALNELSNENNLVMTAHASFQTYNSNINLLQDESDTEEKVRLTETELSISDITQESSSLKSELVTLKIEMDAMKQELVGASESKHDLQQEMKELLEDSKQSEDLTLKKNEIINTLESDVQQLMKEKDYYEDHVTELSGQHKMDLDNIMKSLSIAEAITSEHNLALEEKMTAIKKLEVSKEDTDAIIVTLETKQEELLEEIHNLNAANLILIKEHQDQIAKLTVEKASEVTPDLVAQIEEFKYNLFEKENENSSLKQELLDNNVSAFEKLVDNLEKEKVTLVSRISSLESQVKTKDGRIKLLTMQIESSSKSNTPDDNSSKFDHASGSSTVHESLPDHYRLSFDDEAEVDVEEDINVLVTSSLKSSAEIDRSKTTSDIFAHNVLEKHTGQLNVSDLEEKYTFVEQERNKFKTDNRKLIKVSKGKDAKLKLMNTNFEQIRIERDELLAERDGLENQIQLAKSQVTSASDSSLQPKMDVKLMSPENKTKSEKQQKEQSIAKLQMLIKGREAKIKKLEIAMSDKNVLHDNLNKRIQKLEDSEFELNNELERALLSVQQWQEQCHTLESCDLEGIIVQKDIEIASLKKDHILLKKVNEDNIILEFELQCTKDELERIRPQQQNKEEAIAVQSSELDSIAEETVEFHQEAATCSPSDKAIEADYEESNDVNKLFNSTVLTTDEIKSKVAAILHENKTLLSEKRKLQKLGKGKGAKLKKFEEVVNEQEIVLKGKETDILIIQESAKELTDKMTVLEERENDMQISLNNLVMERDEWRNHCHALEDELDVAHDSIDRKNEEILRMDDEIAADRETFDGLLLERDSLERDNEELISELEDLRTLLLEKDKDIEYYQEQIDNLSKDKESLLSETKKLQMVGKGKSAKVKKLEESFQAHESALDERETLLASSENQLQEMKITLGSYERENSELQTQLTESNISSKSWCEHSKQQELQIDDLNNQLGLKNDEISSLKDCQKDEIANFEAAIKDGQALCKANEEVLAEQYSLIESQKNEMSKLENLMLSKDEELETSRVTMEDKNNALQHMTDVAFAWENRCNEYEQQYHDTQTIVAEKVTELEKLSISHVGLKQTLEEVSLQTKGSDETIEFLNYSNNSLAAETENTKLEVSTKALEIQSLQETCKTLELTIQEKETIITSLNHDHHGNTELHEQAQSALTNLTVDNQMLEQKLIATEHEFEETKQFLEEQTTRNKALNVKCQAHEKQFHIDIDLINEKDNEISKLHGKIVYLDQQCELGKDLMEKQINEKEVLNEKLRSTVSEIEHEREHLNSELFASKAMCEERCKDLDELKQRHIDGKSQLDTHIQDIEMKSAHLQQQVDQLTFDKASFEQQLAWYTQYYNDSSANINASQEKVQTLESSVLELQSVLKDKDDNIINKNAEYAKHIKQKQKENLDLQDTCLNLEQNVKELERELKTTIDESKTQLNQLNTSYNALSKENEAENISFEQIMREKDGKLDALRQDLIKAYAEIKEHQCRICEITDENSLLLSQNSEFATSSSDTCVSCANKEAALLDLQNEIEKLQCENIKFQHMEYTFAETQKEQEGKDILELTSKCQQLQIQLDKYKESVAELPHIKEHSQVLKEEVDQYTKTLEAQQALLSQHELRYSKLEDLSTETENRLKADLEVLHAELTQIRQELKHIESKMQSVQAENDEFVNFGKLKDEEILNAGHLLKEKGIELAKLMESNAMLQETSHGLQAEKQSHETLLASDKEEIQSLYEQMNELVSEKLDLECLLQAREKDLKSTQVTLQQLTLDNNVMTETITKNEELLKAVETLTRDLAMARDRLKSRDEELLDLAKFSQDKEAEISQLNERIEMDHKILLDKSEIENSISETLRLKEDENNIVKQELESKKEATRKLNDMCLEKDLLIESLKGTVNKATAEIEKSHKQCSNLNDEISLFKTQLLEEEHKRIVVSDETAFHLNRCCELESELKDVIDSNELKIVKLTDKDNEIKQLVHELDRTKCSLLNAEEKLTSMGSTKVTDVDSVILVSSKSSMSSTVNERDETTDVMDSSEVVGDVNLPNIESQIVQAVEANQMLDTGMEHAQSVTEPQTNLQESRSEIQPHQLITNERLLTYPDSSLDSIPHPDSLSNTDSELFTTSIRKLQEELQVKADEIARLTELTSKHEGVDRKLQEKDEKIAFLLENMQEMEERLSQLTSEDSSESLQDELRQKTEEIESLENLVAEKEVKFAKALATAKKIKIQLNKTTATLEDEKNKTMVLEKEIKTLKSEQEAITQTPVSDTNQSNNSAVVEKDTVIQDLQSQLLSYSEFCQQLQGQVQNLTDTVHKFENTEKQLQDSVTTLQQNNFGLNNNISESENIILEIKTEIKNKEVMLEEKEKMNVLLQGELDSTSNYLRSVEDQVKSSPSEMLQQEIHQCQVQLQEARNKIASLSGTVMDKETELTEMEQQVVGHETTIQLLQNELKCNIAQEAKLKADMQNLQFEFDTKQTEFTSLIMTHENRASELSVLTQQLQSDLVEKTNDYAAIIEQVKLHEQCNEALKQEISDTKVEINKLNSSANEFASIQRNLSEKEMKLAHLTENLNQMSEILTDKDNSIETLNTEISRIRSTVMSLEDSLKSKCIEVEDLLVQSNSSEMEKQVIDEDRQTLRKDTEDLKEEIKLSNLECTRKMQQIADFEVELDTLEGKNQHLTNTISDLEETLHTNNVELETLKNVATSLEDAKEEILKKDSVAHELATLNEELTHQHEDLIERLGLSMETIEGLQTELHNKCKSIEALNAENDATKLLVKESDSELSECRNTVDILKNSLVEKDHELVTLGHKLETLSNEIAMLEPLKKSSQLEHTGIEEMKTTICRLNVQIESISTEKERAVNSAHLVSEKLVTAEKRLDDVNTEKSSLFEDLSATQDEIEALKIKNIEVFEDRDRLASEINGYFEKQKQDSVRIEEINCNLVSSHQQCSELSQTGKQISERNCDLENTIENLNKTNTDLCDNIASLKNEIDTLLNRVQTFDEKSQESKHSYDKQKKQYDTLLADYENMNQQNIELQHQINGMLNTGPQSAIKPAAAEGSYEESDWGEPWDDSVIQDTVRPLESNTKCKSDSETQFDQVQEEKIQALETDSLCSDKLANKNNVEFENLKEEFDTLSNKYNSLSDEYTSVKEKLQANEIKFEKMLAKLKVFKDRNDNYQIEVGDLRQQLAAVERTGASDKDYLQHQCDMLQKQVETLQDKLLSEETLHQKEIQMSQMLKKDLENKTKQIQFLEKEVDDFKTEKYQIESNLTKTQAKFEKQININNTENVEVQNRNIELLETIDEWKHSVDIANTTVKELQTEHTALTMKIEDLTIAESHKGTKIIELGNEVKDLKNQLAISSIDMEEQKQKLAMSQRQVQDVKEQYDMLEKDNQSFQDLLENMSKTNTDLKNVNIRQKMLIDNLQSEQKKATEKSEHMKSLETSLHEMKTEKGYLEEDLNSMQNELVKLVNENKTVNEENRNLETMIDDLQSENADIKQTMDGLNWKIDELKMCESELESARTNIDTMLKDKKELQNEAEKRQNEILQYHSLEDKLGMSNVEVHEKDKLNADLKENIEKQNKVIEQMKQVEHQLNSSKSELSASQTECASLRKQSDRLSKKLQTFDMLKEEYETLNDDYNTLLRDNSGLAKQIEELHMQLKSASTSGKESELSEAQKQHFVSEKNTLLARIDELETQCQEMRNKNSEFMEEHSKLKDDLQQTKFERDSLQARQETISIGDKQKHFQGDYEKLQQQFSVVMQQKNKVQKDLHIAQRSLSQREARCQQLAMQVSQLAEDRSYLNVELATLSKNLREKEQEASLVQTQYRKMYRAHVTTQAKIAEMERNAVLEVMQRSSVLSESAMPSTTQTATRPDIEQQRRMDREQAAAPGLDPSNVIEKPPEISWRDRLGEDVSLDELSSITSAGTDSEDGDLSKIRERQTVLTRRGNSYLNRLQRWMSLGRSLPPESTIVEEKPVSP